MSAAKQRMHVDSACRMFNEKWTYDYFFTVLNEKAVCLICKESVAVFKKYNLSRHFERKHAEEYKGMTAEEKARKAEELLLEMEEDLDAFVNNVTQAEEATGQSLALHKNAKNGLPSVTEGELVKEGTTVDTLSQIVSKPNNGLNLTKKPAVKCNDMTLENLLPPQRTNNFIYFSVALSLYEEGNQEDRDQLMVFIRGIDGSFELVEELAATIPMKDIPTANKLTQVLSHCFSSFGVQWKHLVSVATDGNEKLTDGSFGLLSRIQDQVGQHNLGGNIIFLHSIIHQEVLCRHFLKLSSVLDVVTKVFTFLKGTASNHVPLMTMFKPVMEPKDDGTNGAYESQFSVAEVLKKVWQLKSEIGMHLDKMKKLGDFPQFRDNDWLSDFAFAVDIMGHVDELDSRMQRGGMFAYNICCCFKSFAMKLLLFSHQIENKQFFHFPALNQADVSGEQLERYISLLLNLHAEFTRRLQDFQSVENKLTLVASPFFFEPDKAPFDLQLELIDMQSYSSLLDQFRTLPILRYYASLDKKTFPRIKAHALKMFVLFGSTSICERAYSTMKLNMLKQASTSITSL